MMKLNEFLDKLNLALTEKTVYVSGCFGAPLTGNNVERYTSNHSYNVERKDIILAHSNQNPPVYGFDCVNLIKGIIWGWNANPNSVYGGAVYMENGLNDINEDTMIILCDDVSSDMTSIDVGEVVYYSGHIGVYIGNGEVIECTPIWEDGVQVTKLTQRNWLKHGKLPWVDYTKEIDTSTGEKAIEYLNKMGKLSSPEYWISAIQIVNNLGFVFMKWAEDVKNLE